MIAESFYLSDAKTIPRALALTELSQDELESIVGYFTKRSHRTGLRGEVVINYDGSILIRHHFTKKKLWRKET